MSDVTYVPLQMHRGSTWQFVWNVDLIPTTAIMSNAIFVVGEDVSFDRVAFDSSKDIGADINVGTSSVSIVLAADVTKDWNLNQKYHYLSVDVDGHTYKISYGVVIVQPSI